jgi:multidrug transporter EmrE-like cation transporter
MLYVVPAGKMFLVGFEEARLMRWTKTRREKAATILKLIFLLASFSLFSLTNTELN